MAINVSQAFHRTSANPIDESMALTKAQMLAVNDNLMPAYYFTICQDDGKIYLYDKSATVSGVTGKFRVFEGGEGSGLTVVELTQDQYDALSPSDKKDTTKLYFIISDRTTKEKTWEGLDRLHGECIWTDGSNIYYSNYVDGGANHQYRLSGNTWVEITWTGYNNIDAHNVWTDGTNIYFSNGVFGQYKLNGTNWETVNWNGFSYVEGRNIWTDRTNIYYSSGSSHYKLNNTTWEEITFAGLTDFDGEYIWTDGINIYYSKYVNASDNSQYKLNGTTWEQITWNGFNNISGTYIWTDGIDTYYSYNTLQYKLNGMTWEQVTWDGLSAIYGSCVWTDGINYYHSLEEDTYELIPPKKGQCIYYKDKEYAGTGLDAQFSPIEIPEYKYANLPISDKTDKNKMYFVYGQEALGFVDNKIYLDSAVFEVDEIWHDGENTYYSNGYAQQYKFNGTTWEPTSWYEEYEGETYEFLNLYGRNIWNDVSGKAYLQYDGQTYEFDGSLLKPVIWTSLSINGKYIWTDGTNTYYSFSTTHYKLNGVMCELVTWTGLTSFSGEYIWTDGTNIYYSYSTSQYKLNGTNWETVTWTGLTSFSGAYIWTDGINTYYSSGSTQKKLNGTTWEDMTWSGLTSLYGNYIWTDGINTYYSSGTSQYKLNGTNWETMTWTGLTSFSGAYIWTDGINTYYSSGTSQYKLNGTTWESMTWSGLTDFSGNDVWTDGNNTYFSSGTKQYKLNGTTWEQTCVPDTSRLLSPYNIWNNGKDTFCNDYSYGSFKLVNNCWTPISFTGIDDYVNPGDIWTYGANAFYSTNSGQYQLYDTTWTETTWVDDDDEPIYFNGSDVWVDNNDYYYYSYRNQQYRINIISRKLTKVTWSGIDNVNVSYIWKDVTGVYYNDNRTTQYKLRYTNWEPITILANDVSKLAVYHIWNDHDGRAQYSDYSDKFFVLDGNIWKRTDITGAPYDMDGHYVWYDGDNIYYSKGDRQYKLIEKNWEQMTWTGLTRFDGTGVWTDGTDIYYSYQTDQYKLNDTTWEPITWSGLTSFYGGNIWTDGTNVYYSSYLEQYKLNGTIWESMTWNKIQPSSGSVWHYKDNTYYSSYSNQYILIGTTWIPVTWKGLDPFESGSYIWTNGNEIYYAFSHKLYNSGYDVYYDDTECSKDDLWHPANGVIEGNTVTFEHCSENLAYMLFHQNKPMKYKSVTESGSGNDVTITYVIKKIQPTDVFRLRILR